MKRLIQTSIFLLLTVGAIAQETSPQIMEKVLQVYDWKDLTTPPSIGQIISMEGMPILKIENTNKASLEVLLLTVTNSALLQNVEIVEWEMKYKNISSYGAACELLEKYPARAVGGDAWTNLSGFSFGGTKNWDKYDLDVRRAPYDGLTFPNELALKFVLPTNGIIYLRLIKLIKFTSDVNWWTPQQAGEIGGIGGSVIGCFGALIGLLASKGKTRKFVLAMTKIYIALGILSLIAGGIAAATKQPYAVYYPLLLMGFILTVVFSVNLPSIQRRYDELEIRRMTSVDTMGG